MFVAFLAVTSDDLKSMLMEFTLPPELIAVTVNTLSKVDSLEHVLPTSTLEDLVLSF